MGIARLEKLDRILAVPAGEPLGLVDRGHETLPADRAVDGGERIAVFGFGCDQLVTHPGEETDGPVDQAAVVAEGGQLAALGAAEHAADQAIVQVERRIGQLGAELERHRHQDTAPTAGGQVAQVAGRETLGLAAQSEQVMPRHAQGARRLEAEGANVVEPFDDGDEAGGARLFRRLADPSQPARPAFRPRDEEPLQTGDLLTIEVVGEIVQGLAFGTDEGGGAQPLDRRDRRHDQPPSSQLVAQADRQLASGRRQHRGLVEPGFDLLPWPARERPVAERILQRRGMLVAGVLTKSVVGEGAGLDADLLGDEGDGWSWDALAGLEQPAGVAQGTELEREAETVVGAAATVDHRQLGLAQGVVAREVGAIGGQGEQRGPLGRGQDGSAGHEVLSREGLAGLRSVNNVT
jgi:hypothetical protein